MQELEDCSEEQQAVKPKPLEGKHATITLKSMTANTNGRETRGHSFLS